MCELWADADHFEVTNDLTAGLTPEARIYLPALAGGAGFLLPSSFEIE